MKRYILGISIIIVASSIWYFRNADIYQAKSDIREMVRDPSSVKFYNVRKVSDILICGEFNAKNGFGAYSGKRRFVSLFSSGFMNTHIEPHDDPLPFERFWYNNCVQSTNGGNKPVDTELGKGCKLEDMVIGEKCNGVIYAGESSGNRLYTTSTDQGQFSWNNGSTNYTATGASSTSEGWGNTFGLVTRADADIIFNFTDAEAPYYAASSCHALGMEWYLPSQDELNVLYLNRDAIGGFNETGSFPAGYYWSSSEHLKDYARHQNFKGGEAGFNTKFHEFSVRCVRR